MEWDQEPGYTVMFEDAAIHHLRTDDHKKTRGFHIILRGDSWVVNELERRSDGRLFWPSELFRFQLDGNLHEAEIEAKRIYLDTLKIKAVMSVIAGEEV